MDSSANSTNNTDQPTNPLVDNKKVIKSSNKNKSGKKDAFAHVKSRYLDPKKVYNKLDDMNVTSAKNSTETNARVKCENKTTFDNVKPRYLDPKPVFSKDNIDKKRIRSLAEEKINSRPAVNIVKHKLEDETMPAIPIKTLELKAVSKKSTPARMNKSENSAHSSCEDTQENKKLDKAVQTADTQSTAEEILRLKGAVLRRTLAQTRMDMDDSKH